jgi:hypothetical protein
MAFRQRKVSPFTPQPLLAELSGHHISDGIEIGRNVESPPEQVVSRIDDDRQLIGGNNLPQPIHKLGAARSAGQNRDHAATFF